MANPKTYADFQNLDDSNRVRLTCAGTIADLTRQGIQLRDALVLTLCMDDANDLGQPDELRVEGIVHYNHEEDCWVAAVDWATIWHASEEKSANDDARVPSALGTRPLAIAPAMPPDFGSQRKSP